MAILYPLLQSAFDPATKYHVHPTSTLNSSDPYGCTVAESTSFSAPLVAASCVAVKHVSSRKPDVFGVYSAFAFFKILFVLKTRRKDGDGQFTLLIPTRASNTKRNKHKEEEEERDLLSSFSPSLFFPFFLKKRTRCFWPRKEQEKERKRERREAIYTHAFEALRTNFEPTFVSLTPPWKCMVFLKSAIELDLRISKRTKCRWARCSSSK